MVDTDPVSDSGADVDPDAGDGAERAAIGDDVEPDGRADRDAASDRADGREADGSPGVDGPAEPDDWYRWGRVVLYVEMVVAVLVTAFSLYLAFTGQAGFLA